MENETSKIVDFVDCVGNSLLVEFAKTGINRHFRKIHIGAIERTAATNFMSSVYVETQDQVLFDLVYEAQEFDYANKPKLRHCVIEQFETEAAATDALEKVKRIIAEGQMPREESTSAAQGTIPKQTRRKDIAEMVMLTVVSVTLLLGGSGAFMGGLALYHRFYQ